MYRPDKILKVQHSPAKLMLAGVAFTDAGVRILLLLLGVTPIDRQTDRREDTTGKAYLCTKY